MESPRKFTSSSTCESPAKVKLDMDIIFSKTSNQINQCSTSFISDNNFNGNSFHNSDSSNHFTNDCSNIVTLSKHLSANLSTSISSSYLESLLLAPCIANNDSTYTPPGVNGIMSSLSLPDKSLASILISNSPRKPRYSDRLIPVRTGNAWRSTWPSPSSTAYPSGRITTPKKRGRYSGNKNSEGSHLYSSLLMNEVLGSDFEFKQENEDSSAGLKRARINRKLFNYDVAERSVVLNEPSSAYSVSPISHKSKKLLTLASQEKPARRISNVPFKVLDAPELEDDFYLNLVDWSPQNVLGVGLSRHVYLWSANNSKVTLLCDLGLFKDRVTSVAWNEKGNLLAVGTQAGLVQVWDSVSGKQVHSFSSHDARVGVLAWNGELLSSGSRDRNICQKDIREPKIPPQRLVHHKQEVCGLKWSPDNLFLASGGNDNRLLVWDSRFCIPIREYIEHMAAVKAIAWSPHQHGLLASGGGTSDKCIRFWNTLIDQVKSIQCIQTGSQICNLLWSKNSLELVSTHGYSLNEVVIWEYPSMNEVAKLTGHRARVLYLAMSPDGEAVVTGAGAGDETLRFWNVFRKSRNRTNVNSSLNFYTSIR